MTDNKHLAFNPELINITVETLFLPSYSNIKLNEYFFCYTITIANLGDCPVQLLSRHWIISDSSGAKQEVRGEGVVGEQPRISPGSSFRYTSGVSIKSSIGTMMGSYSMSANVKNDDGFVPCRFKVSIPAFSLHTPNSLH